MKLSQAATETILRIVKRHAGVEARDAAAPKLEILCGVLHMRPDEVTKVGYYLAHNWLDNAGSEKHGEVNGTGYVLHPKAMKVWGEIRSCSATYLREVFEGPEKVPFTLGRLDLTLQAYRLRYPSYIAREGDYQHWTAEVVCWFVGLGIAVDEQKTYRGFPYTEAYRYAWAKVPADYAESLRRVASVDKTIEMHEQGLPLEYAISLIVG